MNDSISFRDDGDGNTNIEIVIKTKKVVSLKVSEEMYEWIENVWRTSGFSSRSDYLRALVSFIIEDPSKVEKANGDLLPIKANRTITFKVDKNILKSLDELIVKKGYTTRSDLLRVVLYSLMNTQS
ncbi:MAG: ribbon-helix-helix domain-containing protein [Fervidicoccaceae archaeon]